MHIKNIREINEKFEQFFSKLVWRETLFIYLCVCERERERERERETMRERDLDFVKGELEFVQYLYFGEPQAEEWSRF